MKKPCVGCGNLVDDSRPPSYDEHSRNCPLVEKWNRTRAASIIKHAEWKARALVSHTALLKACKAAVAQLDLIGGREDSINLAVIEQCEKAIQLAEGETSSQ